VIADAGGLPAADGTEVRRGRLLRVSGDLVTQGDLPALDALGVRALVDLRGRKEDRRTLGAWAATAGVPYRWLPIDVAGASDLVRRVRTTTDAEEATGALGALYATILDEHAAQLCGAVTVIAEGSPVAFGCAAGKDRTGLVAALVHSVLGVPEDVLVRSWMTSPPTAERLGRMLLARGDVEAGELEVAGLAALLGTPEPALRGALAHLRAVHGGPERYLLDHGVAPEALAALRADLLVQR
jgi:protein-tyrosine phosphatase